MSVGNARTPEEAQYYEDLALKEMRWLAEHPGNDSSHRKRDFGEEEKSVAIMAERIMFSCAVLPGLGNEALMLVVAVLTDELSSQKAEVIARMSQDAYFRELLDAVREA